MQNISDSQTKFLCDKYRHLICVPYSRKGLHQMADELGINRCWFHKDHYDIPKLRMAEIEAKCIVVPSRVIKLLINASKISVESENPYVCYSCGEPFLPEAPGPEKVTTHFRDVCGICGTKGPVTHIRHYSYLRWTALLKRQGVEV